MLSILMQNFFVDDISLITVDYNQTVAAGLLNRYLKFITDWAYQYKMKFYPNKNN